MMVLEEDESEEEKQVVPELGRVNFPVLRSVPSPVWLKQLSGYPIVLDPVGSAEQQQLSPTLGLPAMAPLPHGSESPRWNQRKQGRLGGISPVSYLPTPITSEGSRTGLQPAHLKPSKHLLS
jgi:hypothetical protein